MNEMIFGNTGTRDEGINIDMEQSLYQKLKGVAFVPKLKSLLNDTLQEADKSFVFIGEVSDKSGSFSVYGYNAKLKSDSRGGDYGHYIAVAAEEKAILQSMEDIKFLTEEGFVEYVNKKSLNDNERFKILPKSVDMDINAKKRIINNLMEAFMRVRKRKSVTFSFEDCPVEEFNAKSFYVLCDLMKYLPYCMRKNISFISRVDSNARLPEMINLAAYPSSSVSKPYDSIDLSSSAGWDGVFREYTEKVFSMNDEERKRYFEQIYQDIEKPASEHGIGIKSDLYLLDVKKKELWTKGNTAEAIDDIFNSVNDVLSIYPFYNELAKKRLSQNEAEAEEYIKNRIIGTKNTEELKSVFLNVSEVYKAVRSEVGGGINEIFKAHAAGFIAEAGNDDEAIRIVGDIADISREILGEKAASNKFRECMSKKTDINGIYSLYLKLKEKRFIEPHELNVCLNESVEALILKSTEAYSEEKEKLAALEDMYEKFRAACRVKDYPHVEEVYNRYKIEFSGNVKSAAVKKGNDIIYELENKINGYCTFFDVKNCIIRLAETEVGADETLKKKACDVYRKISVRMFDSIYEQECDYEDLKRLIYEIGPAVKKLDYSGVYDAQPVSGWGSETYVPDGMYKFVSVFEAMIDNIGNSDNLTNVLYETEMAEKAVREQWNLERMFRIAAPKIVLHWMKKNRKAANENALKKAERTLQKQYDTHISRRINEMFEDCLEQLSRGARSKPFGKPVIIGVAAVAAVAVIFGGVKLFGVFVEKDNSDTVKVVRKHEKFTISSDEKRMIEQYLENFKHENGEDARIVIGSITKSEENGQYKVEIKDKFEADFEDSVLCEYAKDEQNSKEPVGIEEVGEDDYAIVLQKENEKTYIRDIFPNLENYDFSEPYRDEAIEEEKADFCSVMIKYVGFKKGLVEEETEIFDEEPNLDDEQTEEAEEVETMSTEEENVNSEEKSEEKQEENSGEKVPEEESEEQYEEENSEEEPEEKGNDKNSDGKLKKIKDKIKG